MYFLQKSSSSGRKRAAAEHPFKLLEELDDRQVRDSRLDAGRGHERPGPPDPPVEQAAGAVGEALLLAEVHVQPAGELPAEDGVHHGEREVVGRGPLRRRSGPRDDRLGRAWLVDEQHLAPAGGKRSPGKGRPAATGRTTSSRRGPFPTRE